MKVKTIEVQNFKAIESQSVDFNGCSAIVTAGNNKGKTSILRGLIDRFHGEKPELIVKKDEQKGFYRMDLTDGSSIEWKFTEKGERITYITKEGFKVSNALTEIGKKYFGVRFDIDKFFHDSAKKQSETLQKLIGLDFTDIDKRFKIAYDDRTYKNRVLADLVARKVQEPEKAEHRETGAIQFEIHEIESENEKLESNYDTKCAIESGAVLNKNNKLKEDWKIENERHLKEIESFNESQRENSQIINAASLHVGNIKESLTFLVNECNYQDDLKEQLLKSLNGFSSTLSQPEELKEIKSLTEPTYEFYELAETPELKPTEKLESELETSTQYFSTYNSLKKDFDEWVSKGKKARKEQQEAADSVSEIQKEKILLIKGAKMPEGFEFGENGIIHNGLPLSNAQSSSSAKYIAALKLGRIGLGELQTMHFDASFLDNNSLKEIMEWSEKEGLQLLIERPDMDGGEIQYNIIEKNE